MNFQRQWKIRGLKIDTQLLHFGLNLKQNKSSHSLENMLSEYGSRMAAVEPNF